MKIAKDKAEQILKRLAMTIRKKNTPGPHSIFVHQKFIIDPDFSQFLSEKHLGSILNYFQFEKLPGEVFHCECSYLGSLYSFSIKDLDGNILSIMEKNYPLSKVGRFSFYAVLTTGMDLVEKTVSFGESLPPAESIELKRIVLFDHEFEDNQDE